MMDSPPSSIMLCTSPSRELMNRGVGFSTSTTRPMAKSSVSFLSMTAGSSSVDVRFSDSMKASGGPW